jgi:hypothetical protein
MTHDKTTAAFSLLSSINASCNEVQQALKEHLDKTNIQQYKIDIEKDLVTLENLKLITVAVREYIEAGKVGATTELLLRIAANDFKNKLNMIPEKKTLTKEIMNSLKEIHREILHHTIRQA